MDGREFLNDAALTIVAHLPEAEARKAEERGLAKALANYFGERAEMSDRDLRELFRIGRRYLSIGLTVLLICFATSQIAPARLGTGPVAPALEESMFILGWITNWKPIETFRYDWWPVKRRYDHFRRLGDAVVEIKMG